MNRNNLNLIITFIENYMISIKTFTNWAWLLLMNSNYHKTASDAD